MHIIYQIADGMIVRYGDAPPDLNAGDGLAFLTVDAFEPMPLKQVNLQTLEVEALKTAPEPSNLSWDDVRFIRDAMIAATDYTVLPDATIDADMKTQVLAYRQALRDIPTTYASPGEVEWPMNPITLAKIVAKYGITQEPEADPTGDSATKA